MATFYYDFVLSSGVCLGLTFCIYEVLTGIDGVACCLYFNPLYLFE